MVQWLWPSNRPHPTYFSFAGVSAGKLTAVACTQNESHFKLLTQAPQQRGSHYEPGKATTASQRNRAVKELVPNAQTFATLLGSSPSFSWLGHQLSSDPWLPYHFRPALTFSLPSIFITAGMGLPILLQFNYQSPLEAFSYWDCITLHTRLHWRHLVRARPAFGGKQDDWNRYCRILLNPDV